MATDDNTHEFVVKFPINSPVVEFTAFTAEQWSVPYSSTPLASNVAGESTHPHSRRCHATSPEVVLNAVMPLLRAPANMRPALLSVGPEYMYSNAAAHLLQITEPVLPFSL